jgi:hypothetical protein
MYKSLSRCRFAKSRENTGQHPLISWRVASWEGLFRSLIDCFIVGSADFLFSLEPVLKFGAGFIPALDAEFISAATDALFKRECFGCGFFDACSCRHEFHLRA